MSNVSGQDELVTKQELKAFYQAILPYLSNGSGGTTYTAGDGIDIINDIISTKKTVNGDLDEVMDQLPVAGNLVSIVNAFNKGDLYSTEERMIGQWIDGKPLYQKTLIGKTSSSNGYAIYSIGASVEMGFVVNAYLNNGSDLLLSLDTVDKTLAGTLKALIYTNANTSNPNELAVYNSVTTWRNRTFVVTIQYTKTTDNPVSIGDANEFSTDEKIIGTWIDGKPIYQKTVVLDKAYSHNDYVPVSNNIDKIINYHGFIYADSNSYLRSFPWNGGVYEISINEWNSTGIELFARREGSAISIKAGSTLIIQYTKTTD